ncbi:MAG: hypothetical protein KDH96_08055 [Candidatus Riesia sp.]|nr:hypothetical protein [Candidatus Riesia sp.]
MDAVKGSTLPGDVKTTKKSRLKFDPNEGIEQVPYPRPLVEAIDKIIEMKRKLGVPDRVEGENGWKVFAFTFNVWATLYPAHYKQFTEDQKETWSTLNDDFASAKEGEARIRKLVNVPQKLYEMISAVFPDQKWDKPFLTKMAKKFPELRGGRKV